MECDSKRIEKVYIYKPKLAAGIGRRRIRLYHVVFLLLYFYQIIWVVSTIGEPYREFLEKADREGFQVMEGQTKMRAELQHSLDDINDPNRYTKKIGWMDWMEMDIEEHADRKRREKERNVLDSLPKHMRVPSRYATTFFPSLLLGILVTIHSLVLLLQHWSVSFNTWINFQSVDAETVRLSEEMIELNPEEKTKIDPGKNVDLSLRSVPPYLPTHARIVPAKGRHILVPIVYFPSLGMTFEYHRRRYVFDTDSSLWIKIRCRTNIPLNFFGKWKGFVSDEQTLGALLRYGPNAFQIRQPTFSKMYKAQLLSPFTVFQLFCVILWMLDDYWQYSAFTLFMILTFEATVVFSRLKSLQALRGMGNKTRPVWVYRIGRWIQVDSTELLPGDFLSLTRIKPRFAKNDKENKKRSIIEDEGGDITPADLLILRGSTVVNEASLTGESVPQMKEGLQESMEEEELSMKTTHKSHIVYAGTKLLLCSGESDEQNYALVPKAPDGGALTFVLRTGFSSAQGKLVRMIEGSQEKVKGHERETGLLLLLLFFFAVASSSYVLYHGLQNDKRSQYELLLHCILIITSVIPPELPMQMAMAVNNSLMTLMRMQIFCTEPFRVPIAGKLDSCLFDKTGTLTTDELVAVGVCEPAALTRKMSGTEDTSILTVMSKVGEEAALVLAGCHSLVFIDNETTGDPLESAALKSMRWTLSPSKATVKPAGGTEKEEGGKPLKIKNEITISEIEILTRHHFSSKLQSMSCVIRSVNSQNSFAVAKGSSEAIGKMLVNKPEGYDEKAKYLAKEGYRVIALAYKELDLGVQIEGSKESRVICEADLSFAGFIAFTCRVRKDTKSVLKRLREGGMSIAMVTGDAILTAIHVSKEVGICTPISGEDEEDLVKGVEEEANEELRTLLAQKRGVRSEKKKNPKHFRPILILEQSNGIMYWQNYDDDSRIAEYHANSLPNLSKEYDLATTGKMLAAAFEFDENTRSVLEHIKIFARMTPDAKETVIECLHSVGRLCLMCGDGANDVGALKQADVGVALLSGFGDLNVDRGEDSHKKKKARKDNIPTAIISQEHLAAIRALPIPLLKMKIRSIGVDPSKYPDLIEKEDLVKLYQIKSREIAVKRHNEKNSNTAKKMSKAELQAKVRADAAEKQQKVIARAAELEAKGEKWATFKAMREFYSHEVEESKKKKRAHGTIEGSASVLAAQFEEVESGELPMVKIGDASVAAPFTSKMPSIQSCVDIVRQGRCTLVSSIQMYQILALNCLISSYSLSVLYLDGVKYGDTQMTAMGMLGTISYMSVSRSKPLDRLSKVRPLTSIFHPAHFISLLGQFAIHLVTMFLATRSAKSHLSPDYEPDLDGIFKPGILNTVVFLVSSVQQVCVFVVNLQGRPFMTGLTENRPLLWSLLGTFILTFMFASETVPKLNKYFQLVSFPDDMFRDYILKLLAVDVCAAFLLDRLLKLFFCPKILFASIEGTTLKDVMGLGRTIGVIFFLMYTFLGNEDTWEELMKQEGRFEELGINTTNMTNSTNTTIMKVVTETVSAAVATSMTDNVGDEF